jgi:hypothetical protein
MERSRVVSSDIASVGYDALSSILEVEFNTGSIYQYRGVPESVYFALMNAPSHGQYFARHIKKGPYPYTRVR